MARETKVLWELEAQGQGTIVRLTRTEFAGEAEQARNYCLGWLRILGWLLWVNQERRSTGDDDGQRNSNP